jgi:hypothetical protein
MHHRQKLRDKLRSGFLRKWCKFPGHWLCSVLQAYFRIILTLGQELPLKNAFISMMMALGSAVLYTAGTSFGEVLSLER